jgi:hypothetical protein
MKFSLITVHERNGDRVSGNWVQDHIGTLESASVVARRTEAANGNQITVAVVEQVNSAVPALSYWSDQRRLDA